MSMSNLLYGGHQRSLNDPVVTLANLFHASDNNNQNTQTHHFKRNVMQEKPTSALSQILDDYYAALDDDALSDEEYQDLLNDEIYEYNTLDLITFCVRASTLSILILAFIFTFFHICLRCKSSTANARTHSTNFENQGGDNFSQQQMGDYLMSQSKQKMDRIQHWQLYLIVSVVFMVWLGVSFVQDHVDQLFLHFIYRKTLERSLVWCCKNLLQGMTLYLIVLLMSHLLDQSSTTSRHHHHHHNHTLTAAYSPQSSTSSFQGSKNSGCSSRLALVICVAVIPVLYSSAVLVIDLHVRPSERNSISWSMTLDTSRVILYNVLTLVWTMFFVCSRLCLTHSYYVPSRYESTTSEFGSGNGKIYAMDSEDSIQFSRRQSSLIARIIAFFFILYNVSAIAEYVVSLIIKNFYLPLSLSQTSLLLSSLEESQFILLTLALPLSYVYSMCCSCCCMAFCCVAKSNATLAIARNSENRRSQQFTASTTTTESRRTSFGGGGVPQGGIVGHHIHQIDPALDKIYNEVWNTNASPNSSPSSNIVGSPPQQPPYPGRPPLHSSVSNHPQATSTMQRSSLHDDIGAKNRQFFSPTLLSSSNSYATDLNVARTPLPAAPLSVAATGDYDAVHIGPTNSDNFDGRGFNTSRGGTLSQNSMSQRGATVMSNPTTTTASTSLQTLSCHGGFQHQPHSNPNPDLLRRAPSRNSMKSKRESYFEAMSLGSLDESVGGRSYTSDTYDL